MSDATGADRLRDGVELVSKVVSDLGSRVVDVFDVPHADVVHVEVEHPDGSRSKAVVHAGGTTRVSWNRGKSVPASSRPRVVNALVARTEPGGEGPTPNRSFRALEAARSGPVPEVVLDAYSGIVLGLITGDWTVHAYASTEEVEEATRVLADLASGTPVEWVLRRATPRAPS